jgi:hypothetical protein
VGTLRKVILFSVQVLWSIVVDVYRYRLKGRNGSVGPDPVCDVRIRSDFPVACWRDATDPWDWIRSVPSGTGPGFTYYLLKRGLSFGSVGPDPDWSVINIIFIVAVLIRFRLLWNRFVDL